MKSVILLCFLLQKMAVSNTQSVCERPVFPIAISYRSNNFEHTNMDNCTTYPSNTPAPPGVNVEEYVRCNHTTSITNGNQGPPFYIWGESPGHLLIEFSGTVNLSSVVIHYQYNATYGLPKLRIYAVPDNFSVWDTPDSAVHESRPFDEIQPGGEGPVGLSQLPISGVDPIRFFTPRILIDKLEDTKDYRFALSEVAFQEFCPQGTDAIMTTTLVTNPQTTQPTQPGQTTRPTQSTDNTSTMMTENNTMETVSVTSTTCGSQKVTGDFFLLGLVTLCIVFLFPTHY